MNSPGEVGGGVRSPQDMVMDMARRPAFLQDAVFETLGVVGFERLQIGDCVLRLLLETARFRDRAASYRDFNVAAGALCVNDAYEHGRALGYNIKLDDTDMVNIHAEDLVLRKVQDADFRKISVLAVIGEVQEDHASGKVAETLHPCGRCRGRLAASPFIEDNTLFITARPDFTVIQFASLSAVRAAHEESDDSGLVTFSFPHRPEILAPLGEMDEWRPDARPIVLSEVDAIDSRDYDETVGLYLLRRYRDLYGKSVE